MPIRIGTLLFAVLLSVGWSTSSANARVQGPEPAQAARALDNGEPIVVSFLSSVDPAAMGAAQSWAAAFKLESCPFLSTCVARDNNLTFLIPKTHFWLPFIAAEIAERTGREVLLDPLELTLDDDGALVAKSGLEPTLSPSRTFFMAYTSPLLSPQGEPMGRRSHGQRITPITGVLGAADVVPGGYNWSGFTTRMVAENKRRAITPVVAGQYWEGLLDHGRDAGVLRGEAVTMTVDRILTPGRSAETGAGAAAYREVLGPVAADVESEVIDQLYRGEIRFRIAQSNLLGSFLVESEYGRGLRETAVTEKKEDDRVSRQMWTMVAASVVTLGAAPAVVMASQLAILQNMQNISQASIQSSALLAEAYGGQLNVVISLLGKENDIQASSVSELRERFRAALAPI